MTTTPIRPTADVLRVRKLRQRAQIAHLDYTRAAVEAVEHVTPTELSRGLGLAQPSVRELVNRGRNLEKVRPGFSGASPYEIAQRYDAEEITREELVDQLGRWDYASGSQTDGYDTLLVTEPGTFAEVTKAFNEGLIDGETYDAIIDRAEARSD